MSLPEPQDLAWGQYEDRSVEVEMSAVGSIAGQTYTFTVREPGGELIFQLTTGAGVAITDNGSTTTAGVIAVTLASAETALTEAGRPYEWELWRTNSGQEGIVARGDVVVGKQQYREA